MGSKSGACCKLFAVVRPRPVACANRVSPVARGPGGDGTERRCGAFEGDSFPVHPDQHNEWSGYHHLPADFPKARLEREDPSRPGRCTSGPAGGCMPTASAKSRSQLDQDPWLRKGAGPPAGRNLSRRGPGGRVCAFAQMAGRHPGRVPGRADPGGKEERMNREKAAKNRSGSRVGKRPALRRLGREPPVLFKEGGCDESEQKTGSQEKGRR